ncbi:FIG00605929: hypothetical protein [hydrothermal vent metagenome]|uniref:Arginine dihydrolase ArgZ/ArgE-like C-terminal second subdomain domain-containing protein n=1 Tax=hydrothermal vent metagenome TaxID=652676 RepID=A0A3B1C6E0_9ZZZZ
MPKPDLFDRSKLRLKPLSERESDFSANSITPLKPVGKHLYAPLGAIAERIHKARGVGAPVIMIIGAHVLRSGVQRYIINMMERGLITLLATNGACAIHDFELALTGSTTESVSRYIAEGQFGLWEETMRINDIVAEGARVKIGMGEALGRAISEGDEFTHRGLSVFAAGYRLGIPVTCHVGIGYDIVHEGPNCDGASYGATSYTDFLRFTSEVSGLENGVVMNFGSSVMGPEVFLKALAMARNVAHTENRSIRQFSTLVCDLYPVPADFSAEPSKSDPAYYFRPLKTMLVRTVAEGGESFYVRGEHARTIPGLWTMLEAGGAEQG